MTRRWVAPAVIAAMLLFSALVYTSLPDRIPTHWNVDGEVDGWSSRTTGALLAPGVALLMWGLLPLLRRIDPRRPNYDRFDPTFRLLINLLVVFMGVIHLLSLGYALGWAIDMRRAVSVMAGVMFVGLGNYLPRLRSNWWMGIRTPWTLESETVWRATHRVAGYTFVAAGLLTMATALLPPRPAIAAAMVFVMVGVFTPAIYSYIAYRRERNEADTA